MTIRERVHMPQNAFQSLALILDLPSLIIELISSCKGFRSLIPLY